MRAPRLRSAGGGGDGTRAQSSNLEETHGAPHGDSGLSDDVKIDLDDNDRKRAKQILEYPWFRGKKPWAREINRMLKNGFKMEVEAMINKRLTYLTAEYTPMKLKEKKQWLD